MVSDGGDDCGDVVRVSAHVVQETEGHYGTALGMVHAVYNVADVVEIACNLNQFNFMFGVAEGAQDLCGSFGNLGHMSEAVLCESEGSQGFIRFLDVGSDRAAVFNIFKCNLQNLSPFSFYFLRLL